jgi:hypothetical protein
MFVQVSVRKAALVALSTLLELFPGEPSLCQAWVASGLPLVRDVEASIQVCLVQACVHERRSGALTRGIALVLQDIGVRCKWPLP